MCIINGLSCCHSPGTITFPNLLCSCLQVHVFFLSREILLGGMSNSRACCPILDLCEWLTKIPAQLVDLSSRSQWGIRHTHITMHYAFSPRENACANLFIKPLQSSPNKGLMTEMGHSFPSLSSLDERPMRNLEIIPAFADSAVSLTDSTSPIC